MTVETTRIADRSHPSIQRLILERDWASLSDYEKIGAAYGFVKDEIAFGYNKSDDLPGSQVLRDGYGQCNTKGNLLFTLLIALGIRTRFHGFTIDKELQRGAIPNWLQRFAPKRILHSWVEVHYQGEWLELEGFILDARYLGAIQARNPRAQAFSGFGIATSSLARPEVEWKGRSTYIQREGIRDDYGTFESPDEFYRARGTNLRGIRRFLYQRIVRHLMNRNVARIRLATSSLPPVATDKRPLPS